MSNLIRCFVSVEVSEDVRDELLGLQKIFKKENLFVGTFTKPEQFHLTLKFLGEIDKFKIEEVKKRLSKIDYGVVKMSLRNVGFFGYEPSVIWVGVDSDNLRGLYDKIEDNIWDILPSPRRFNAHITIARVKSVKYQMLLKKTITDMKVQPVEFEANKFYLMESRPVDGNGRHEHYVLEEYLLK